MAPPSHSQLAKDNIVVQSLGNSSSEEGSRKRRKSIVSPKENANAFPKQSAVELHPISAPASPKSRKSAGATKGIGSRGILVVEK
jgi:hypothetical protein